MTNNPQAQPARLRQQVHRQHVPNASPDQFQTTASSASRSRTATSGTRPNKARSKPPAPADDELDLGVMADEDELPYQTARARRKAKNDAVSAKKTVERLQKISRAVNEKCLSRLGPKKGGHRSMGQLELDNEIAVRVTDPL